MKRLLKRLHNNGSNEKGQALAIVLALLAIGGLTIAVNLDYAVTSLKGSGTVEQNMKGLYAAGAGVESVLWSLGKDVTPPTTLTQNINQMAVRMTTVVTGNYTLYMGGLEDPTDKPGVLTISGNISPVGGDRYRYIITLTMAQLQAGTIHVEEVGARLPVGYTYDDSATRSDGGTIGATNPAQTQDNAQAWMLQFFWTAANRPTLTEGETFILTFYITGTGDVEGEYAWAVADPEAYGIYGEVSGGRYQITSTAVRPTDNRTISKIVADAMKIDQGTNRTMSILSWQIMK